MLAAESLGYSSVWIAEHHFNDYGLCPVPPVLAAFLAARTRTLRLGMGVSLLPLHHPVDLAEQLAVLDVVSGGRLDVGIGRGGTLQDYQTFQSDREDSRARVEEGIALIQQSLERRAVRLRGALPLRRAAARAPAPGAAAAPAALHRGQQRGQRALGGAPGPAHALVVLRADRGAAAPPPALSRGVAGAGRSEAEIEALEDRAWGMRVVHVAPNREEALRAVEGAVHGLPAQDVRPALRFHRAARVPNSFDRSLLRLRTFRGVPRRTAGP